ncbi:cytochrome b5 domain-containing protein [Propioniciclava soli]|uniref:cytochrome b5 domain-containing protein n=1 Tax=Propioniciclava soli TaxID=2775081 RepID=UPI001E3F00BC|nr:cytochrome b5-like heme/steroid binding domain-containing protein [Propioniciclava soli]
MLGLPFHPLVVHAAVVLVPLAALAVIAAVASARWRERHAGLTLVAVVAAAVAAVAARFSGEALAAQLTEPEAHARWGTLTMIAAVALAVLTGWWWVLQRRDADRPGQRGVGVLAVGALAVGAALACLTFVVLAGHSGSTATWTQRLAAPAAAEASPAVAYSLAEVATHADAASCWVAIDGGVYDLTEWVGRHPGGAPRILGLCGTDATERFRAQHADRTRPNAALASFRIGDLA